MKMTRQHFQFIADVLAKFQGSQIQRRDLAKDFADALSTTTPNFDAEKFLKACGIRS